MENRFKNFTILINKIGKSVRKLKTEEMREYGLKGIHVSCIYYLYVENSLTSKELTDICVEDKAAISRALDYLEKNQFIICEDNDKKRYKNKIYLTDKGKEIGKIISKKIDNILEEVSKGLTEENRKQLYQSLSIISNKLNDMTNK